MLASRGRRIGEAQPRATRAGINSSEASMLGDGNGFDGKRYQLDLVCATIVIAKHALYLSPILSSEETARSYQSSASCREFR